MCEIWTLGIWRFLKHTKGFVMELTMGRTPTPWVEVEVEVEEEAEEEAAAEAEEEAAAEAERERLACSSSRVNV